MATSNDPAPGTLIGLYFQPLTSQDIIKRSVHEVKSVKALQHQRFGLPNFDDVCSTCGAKRTDALKSDCQGHSGHIELPLPVYHQDRISSLVKLLNLVCFHCHSLLKKKDKDGKQQCKAPVAEELTTTEKPVAADQVVPDSESEDGGISQLSGRCSTQFSATMPQARQIVPDSEGSEEEPNHPNQPQNVVPEQEEPADAECSVCEGPQWHLRVVDKLVNSVTVPAILMEMNFKVFSRDISTEFQSKLLKDEMFTSRWRSKFLDPQKALRILECVSRKLGEEEKISIGLKAAEDYFIKTLMVPPNWMRYTNEEFYLQDEISKAHRSLLNRIKSIVYVHNDHEISEVSEQKVWELQSAATQCLRANPLVSKSSASADAQTGLKFLRCLTGKVGGSCARAVVRGDPFIKIEEIGIPSKMAADLMVPEAVTSFNFAKLQEYATSGDVFQVVRDGEHFKYTEGELKLQVGDVLYRSLQDGDQVFVNRPPTFHKHALIGLTVKVLGENAISINPLICSPLFADFDGDCLHAFLPQSVEVRAELAELIDISKQLLSSQGGQSIIGLMQDTLLGGHLLMQDNVFVSKEDIDQLQMWCSFTIPTPAIVKSPKGRGPLWTGKQLFEMTLPESVDYETGNGNVIIKQGQVLAAHGSSSAWLGKKGFASSLCNSISPECVLQHLNSAQGVIGEWISERGFSVGLSDFYLVADSVSRRKLEEEILCALEEAKVSSLVHQILSDAHMQMNCISKPRGSLWNDRIKPCTKKKVMQEAAISGFQAVISDLERTVKVHARNSSRDNSLLKMVDANSKGSLSKMVQQGGCVGLQLLQGEFLYDRLKTVFPQATDHELEGRLTSSKFWKAMGLVENSFLDGLDPREFFVLSTATRTARTGLQECGNLFRFLMCFLKDVRIEYDKTVRSTHAGRIINFSYSEEEGEGEPGTPVGILAATGIIEPIYDQVLSSSHQGSGNKEHPLQTLKNILQPAPTAFRDFDRRVMLRLKPSEILKPEWIALKVQDHLRPVTVGMLTSNISIEYNPDDDIDGQAQRAPWIGCFELHAETLRRCGLNVDWIVSYLRKAVLSLSDNSSLSLSVHFFSRSCGSTPVLCFFPVLSAGFNAHSHHEIMRNIMFPYLLGVTVKGCERMDSVTIKWEADYGELVLEASTHEKKKREFPWRCVTHACQSIEHLVDWTKSAPFSVQEVCSVFGIEAAYQILLERLKRLSKGFDRAIKIEHLMLIADVACNSGEVDGFMASGYEHFLKKLHLPLDEIKTLESADKNQTGRQSGTGGSPLALATTKNPGAVFEAAAMDRSADQLCGLIESVFCGKRPSMGTAANFDLFLKEDRTDDKLFAENVDFHMFLLSTQPSISEEEREEMWKKIKELSQRLSAILRNSSLGSELSVEDQSVVGDVLMHHPRSTKKIGCGLSFIKVDNHPKHDCRCFCAVRYDGSADDFSYHKCLMRMLKGDHLLLERYKNTFLKGG